jgi:hypothetical protein
MSCLSPESVHFIIEGITMKKRVNSHIKTIETIEKIEKEENQNL